MSYDDEVVAFRDYQRAFPHNAVLLVDTYDTLRAVRRITVGAIPASVITAI